MTQNRIETAGTELFLPHSRKKKKRRVREGPGMESGMKMKFKDPVIRKGSRVADF